MGCRLLSLGGRHCSNFRRIVQISRTRVQWRETTPFDVRRQFGAHAKNVVGTAIFNNGKLLQIFSLTANRICFTYPRLQMVFESKTHLCNNKLHAEVHEAKRTKNNESSLSYLTRDTRHTPAQSISSISRELSTSFFLFVVVFDRQVFVSYSFVNV